MSEMTDKLLDEIEETDAQLTEEEKRFVVDDDQKAEWCLNKIREAEAERDKWRDFYMDRMEREETKYQNRRAFFEHLLEGYFRTVPKKETKTQLSYPLPSGRLVLKRQGPEYERDDELILAWLKANDEGQYVKVKESVDWSSLKKTLTIVGEQVAGDSGEIIPGITVVMRPDAFKVEVK